MAKRKNFSEQEEKQIVDDYLSGNSFRVVGSHFGISAPTVKKILDKYNISAREKKGIKHCIHHYTVTLDRWTSQEGTDEFDYFIGILATDGSIVNTQVALEFAENNKEILEHYNKFLGDVCNINSRYCPKRNNTYYNIKYKNEEIVNYLANFGIVPRKTSTLKLKYINWSVLRGIFDGDGSIIKDNRSCSFKFKITSGSEDFINQIAEFYNKYNIHCIMSEEHGKAGNSWMNITVGTQKDILKIYQNIYKDTSCFLHRKQEKFGPLLEKFNMSNSVNSVNERENSKTEPSLNEEGAETRNGEPKE